MYRRINLAVILVCVCALMSSVSADDPNDIIRLLNDYVIRYYAEPEPFKSAALLKKYVQSGYFTDEQLASPIYEERFSYFFARVLQMEPDITADYLNMLEEGNHRQRIFMIDVLALGGNEKVRKYFESKLRAGRFVNESHLIRWYLQEGIPYDMGVLEREVSHPYDLEYLIAEFMASGQDKAVVKIIDFLAEPNSLETEPNVGTIYSEYWKKSLEWYGKKDENILKICKEQLDESSGARRDVLEEIIDSIDGSVSIARLVEQYRDEKPVAGAKAWALGASAVLVEHNHDRHNFLSPDPITERNAKLQRQLLEESWGIESTEELLDDLEWLIAEGHRGDFERRGQYVQSLSQQQYEQLLNEYEMDKERQQEIRIARQYYRKLGEKGIIGWDLSRYIYLCRSGFLCGYITEQQAWGKIMPAARILKEKFDSWQDLGHNYLIGRQFWSYKYTQDDGDDFEDAYQRLIDMKDSPWNLYSWNLDLTDANENSGSSGSTEPLDGGK